MLTYMMIFAENRYIHVIKLNEIVSNSYNSEREVAYFACCLMTFVHLRNKFDFWSVHELMNTLGLLQSK